MTIISTKSFRIVNEKDIHAAYGIGEVIMGKSSIAISKIGIRAHHLKKGDLIGICKVVNSDDYAQLKKFLICEKMMLRLK